MRLFLTTKVHVIYKCITLIAVRAFVKESYNMVIIMNKSSAIWGHVSDLEQPLSTTQTVYGEAKALKPPRPVARRDTRPSWQLNCSLARDRHITSFNTQRSAFSVRPSNFRARKSFVRMQHYFINNCMQHCTRYVENV